MATNVYEGLFILDSNRYSRDAPGVSGQIAKIVEKHGGEVLVSRLWEERRLAYPINGQRKGTYWLCYFKLDGDQVTQVERDCRLSDTIHRCLILKVDARIVDALVSHAVSGSSQQTEEPKAAEGEKKPEAETDGETVTAVATGGEEKPTEEASSGEAESPA